MSEKHTYKQTQACPHPHRHARLCTPAEPAGARTHARTHTNKCTHTRTHKHEHIHSLCAHLGSERSLHGRHLHHAPHHLVLQRRLRLLCALQRSRLTLAHRLRRARMRTRGPAGDSICTGSTQRATGTVHVLLSSHAHTHAGTHPCVHTRAHIRTHQQERLRFLGRLQCVLQPRRDSFGLALRRSREWAGGCAWGRLLRLQGTESAGRSFAVCGAALLQPWMCTARAE